MNEKLEFNAEFVKELVQKFKKGKPVLFVLHSSRKGRRDEKGG